jgi:putative tricarboxylic transport membrane protein
MALSLPFEHIMLAKKGKNIDKDRSKSLPSITWLTMLLLICILALFEYTGMLITMFLVCLLMPRLWGEKRLVMTIAFSIGFPLIVAAVFSGILGVHFESGMFGFGI